MVTPLVTEAALADEGSASREGDEYTRQFDVVALSAVDARRVLFRERRIAVGVLYSNARGQVPDPLVRCVQIHARAAAPASLAGAGLYRLTVRYRRLDGSERRPVPGGPPVYQWGRSERQITLEKDRNGKVIANSAGEPYADISRPEAGRTLMVQWYQDTANLPELFAYDNVVNSDVWMIAGKWSVVPGQALVHGIDPFEERPAEGDNQPAMIRLVAQIEFRPGGLLWEPFEIVDYTMRNGVREYLDGAGQITTLEPGQTPTINEFSIYQSRAVRPLGI